jgi:transposase
MCIDEKMIGSRYTLIFSNWQNGKIALLLDSLDPVMIEQAFEHLDQEKLAQVKSVASDMSPVMKRICREKIPNASITIDKFHVIKHLLDALQSVRLDIKKQIKIQTIENHKNPNGWTDLELLEKTKYSLYKQKDTLTTEELSLLNIVLAKYPLLEKAYTLTNELRKWYEKTNIGKPIGNLKYNLYQWYNQVKESKIKALLKIKNMIERHQDDILNYFIIGQTNAKAENLNARIQRLIINNYRTRNRDFLFYRLQIYFSY